MQVSLNDSKVLDYKMLNYYVVAVNGSTIYAQSQTTKKIYSSTNGGESWTELATLSVFIRVGTITASDIVVLIDESGNVLRSSDGGATFATVKTGGYACLVNAIDVNGETVIYAEYTTVGGAYTVNVYRSTDGGATWASVLAKASTEIRHFHTVRYVREIATWIVTSGDGNAETKWWKSTDGGLTWTEVISGAQKWRAVGVTSVGGSTVVWGSDSSPDTYIYAASLYDMDGTIRRIGLLPGHCMGIAGEKNLLIASVRMESTDPKGSLLAPVYVSTDAGASWQMETALTGKAESGGQYGILGPDKYGRYYIQFNNIEESTSSHATLRAVPTEGIPVKSEPVKNSRSFHPYAKAVLDKVAIRNTSTQYSAALKETLFDAVLHVNNALDTTIEIRFSDGGSQVKNSSGTTVLLSVAAGNRALIDLNQLGVSILPTGFLVGAFSATAPTLGDVTVNLYGRVLRYDDHRQFI